MGASCLPTAHPSTVPAQLAALKSPVTSTTRTQARPSWLLPRPGMVLPWSSGNTSASPNHAVASYFLPSWYLLLNDPVPGEPCTLYRIAAVSVARDRFVLQKALVLCIRAVAVSLSIAPSVLGLPTRQLQVRSRQKHLQVPPAQVLVDFRRPLRAGAKMVRPCELWCRGVRVRQPNWGAKQRAGTESVWAAW